MAGARWRGAALAMSGPTVPAKAEAQPETTRLPGSLRHLAIAAWPNNAQRSRPTAHVSAPFLNFAPRSPDLTIWGGGYNWKEAAAGRGSHQ